jgi:hypothetical protein
MPHGEEWLNVIYHAADILVVIFRLLVFCGGIWLLWILLFGKW